MYRRLLLILGMVSALQGGQSLRLVQTPGTVKLPSSELFNNLGDVRLEIRFTNLSACQTAGVWGNNLVTFGGGYAPSIGCKEAGAKSLTIADGGNSMPTYLTAQTLADQDDITVRVQKNVAGSYSMEAWSKSGDPLIAPVSVKASGAKTILNFSGSGNLQIFPGTGAKGSTAVTSIAWLRVYRSVLPLGSYMPMDPAAATDDSIFACEFEGSLQCTAAAQPVTMSFASGNCPDAALSNCFEASPANDGIVVIQAEVSNAVAGDTMTVNALRSFDYSGTPLSPSDFVWQQVSGPSKAVFSNRSAGATTVTGLVKGTYVFQLWVEGTVKQLPPVTVDNPDLNGLALFPSAVTRSVPISFNLADVDGAQYVKLQVRRPDGRIMPPIRCSESSCTAAVDPRQKKHAIKLMYYGADDTLLSESDWQELDTQQTDVDEPRSSSESYGRQGFMIASGLNPNDPAKATTFISSYLDVVLRSGYAIERHPQKRPVINPGYIDWIGLNGMFDVYHAQAALPNDTHENLLLHHKQDWDARRDNVPEGIKCPDFPTALGAPNYRWCQMDRFDAGEGPLVGTNGMKNGVLTCNDPGCNAVTDRSVAAWDNVSADVPITHGVQIGYIEPFDEVNFVISSGATGAIVQWQYWNGATSTWDPLVLSSDTTEAGGQKLAQSGRVRFVPPSNWAKAAKGVTDRSKWWVRVLVSGGIAPTAARIFGDNWWNPEMPAAPRRIMSYTYFTAADSNVWNQLTLDISAARSAGGAEIWEYWNGSTWAAIGVSGNLTGTGSRTITFNAPDNWIPLAYNGSSIPRYWMRVRFSVALNSYPLITAALAGGQTALSTGTGRGWDPNAPGRVNIGMGNLEYNPNPPAGASARFRYQSRAYSLWGVNYFSFNHTAKDENGDYYVARYVRYRAIVNPVLNANTAVGTRKGYELDNAASNSDAPKAAAPGGPSDLTANHLDYQTWPKTAENINAVANLHWLLEQEFGRGGWPLGGNGGVPEQALKLDYRLEEGIWTFNTQNDNMYFNNRKAEWIDPYLPGPGNPNNTKSLLTYADLSDQTNTVDGKGFWDRKNRGPMTALAHYYLVAHENTRFGYNANDGAAIYTTNISVRYRNEQPDFYLPSEITVAGGERVLCHPSFASIAENTSKRFIFGGREMIEYRKDRWEDNNTSVPKLTDGAQPGEDCMVRQFAILTDHPAGEPVYSIQSCLLGVECNPPLERVYNWGWIFPAIGTDVGVPVEPSPSGNCTAAVCPSAWKAGSATDETKTRLGLFKRSYTNAHVLWSATWGGAYATGAMFSQLTAPLNFEAEGLCSGTNCALYPLRADGRTSNEACDYSAEGGEDFRTADGGCTAIRPRRIAEGWILMKQPVY